jgi:hypothetical protein
LLTNETSNKSKPWNRAALYVLVGDICFHRYFSNALI